MCARDWLIQSIVEGSCASLKLSLRGTLENFRVGLNKSVNEAFHAGPIGAEAHAETSLNGINFRFLECAALNDGDGLTGG